MLDNTIDNMTVDMTVELFDEDNSFKRKPPKDELKFEELSFSEFEKKFKVDSFFYDLAGDLLTPYKVLYEDGPWIAGGFLTRSLQGETLENFDGDVDVWFSSHDQRTEFAQSLESGRFGLEVEHAERFKSQYSYSYILKYKERNFKLQLISYRTFPNIKSLLGRFDMFSCMFGTDGVNVFYEANNAIDAAINKKIMFNWNHLNETTAHPDARYCMKRYTKFIKDGYTADNSEINRFTNLIRKIPMTEDEISYDGYGHF